MRSFAAVHFFGVCNISVFPDDYRLAVNVIFYFSAGWIVGWCALSILVNGLYRQFGAHRWLDAFQELGFIVIYVFMGVFVLRTENPVRFERGRGARI